MDDGDSHCDATITTLRFITVLVQHKGRRKESIMTAYVDVFVAAVPTANKQAYLDHAETMDSLCKKKGALSITETWGADVPDGEITSFPMAVKCQADETVVVAWIKWPSKTFRDAAWEDLMKHPDMQPGASPMPFDGKRMILGGFEVMLEL
jgi:uncharacterized protein YbaA (DUF1428 family)